MHIEEEETLTEEDLEIIILIIEIMEDLIKVEEDLDSEGVEAEIGEDLEQEEIFKLNKIDITNLINKSIIYYIFKKKELYNEKENIIKIKIYFYFFKRNK